VAACFFKPVAVQFFVVKGCFDASYASKVGEWAACVVAAEN